MSIETALYTTLTTDSGVTSLCSTRVYPGFAPQSVTRPYVVYQVVSGDRLSTIAGTGDAQRKRIQVSCFGDIYSSAKATVNAVISALEGSGYQLAVYDYYNPDTQLHTSIVDWSFMATT